MILRNLMKASRELNWFTAVLEVLIVVIGIFIGLQVDAWNQARKDRATAASYMDRLYEDTGFNIAQVKDKAQSYHNRAFALARIVAKLQLGKVDEIDIKDLTIAFCYWYVPEGIRLQSSTYEEMTSTGNLKLIREQGILQMLQLARAEDDRLKEENPKLAALQMDLARSLRNYTEWRFDAPLQRIDWEEAGKGKIPVQAGCVVDRPALAADPDISSILVQLNRSQTILGNQLLDEQRALENLLAALEQVPRT